MLLRWVRIKRCWYLLQGEQVRGTVEPTHKEAAWEAYGPGPSPPATLHIVGTYRTPRLARWHAFRKVQCFLAAQAAYQLGREL